MRTVAHLLIWSTALASLAAGIINWPNLTTAIALGGISALLVIVEGGVDYVIREGNAGIAQTRADFEARCAQARDDDELRAHWDTTVFGAPE